MVSTNYTRGRSWEYQTLRKLRAQGWLCSRSAASHGPIDIFAGKDGQILLIQVKSGRSQLTEDDRSQLRQWARAYHGRVEVWYFKRHRGLMRKELII
jgi:Holliday junction resolvase